SLQLPDFLEEMGLDLFEYQCGNGVTVGEATARKLGEAFRAKGKILSLHAPYFISLSSVEEEKRDNSIGYILKAARAADWMGADRIVVHSGSCAKISREEALALAKQTLEKAVDALKNEGLEHISICPETMGKINQLGTLDEVLELCKVHDSFIPTVDFGHLNARTRGGVCTKEDYLAVLNRMEDVLGEDRTRRMHVHFSKIEYTAGGEKKHLTFEDAVFGPDFEPLADLLVQKKSEAHIICESDGTMDIDSLAMKQMYLSALEA
ncbi:MAG: TIM barrel protein, partial [Clostridia bacterium]|nr:TIM barrel protein [Clostridia bacterium]